MLFSALLFGVVSTVLAWQILHRPVADERAWVPPGVSHDGIPLPTAHRLAAPLPPDDDPTEGPLVAPGTLAFSSVTPTSAAASATPSPEPTATHTAGPTVAGLNLRMGCAWGEPGRNPYRGTPEQVLAAVRLPPALVQAVAQRIRARDRTDRVTITSTGIRRHTADVEYDAQRVALSFGRSLCLDTRVNFPPGHREEGDLYEVATADGRRVTVMVPDVCGNVSVLDIDGEAVARWAFADAEPTRKVPVGGTLGHVLIGLGLAAALKRWRAA